MRDKPSPKTTGNLLLSSLSKLDFAQLLPHLEEVDLPLRKQLEALNRRIDSIYFPESGFASVVVDGDRRRSLDVGLIGREGMTGLAVVLGNDRTPHETFIQAAGHGLRMSAQDLREILDENAAIRRRFLQYAHSFLTQTSYTAMANGRSRLEERLARWLLMAHDRLDEDEFRLTHEFLSLMLGVRRSGVTVAVNFLERAGLVVAARGSIRVTDRRGLEKASNGAYAPADAELMLWPGRTRATAAS